MNPQQQVALIQAQVQEIKDTPHCQVIPQDNPLELHLELTTPSGGRYHAMLDLEEYDIMPPKLVILGRDGAPTWHPAKVPPRPFLNGRLHPESKQNFFCIPGTRDYHTHPLHDHEPWDALRNFWPLRRIVAEIEAPIRNMRKVLVRRRKHV